MIDGSVCEFGCCSEVSLNNCVKVPTKFEVKVVSGVRLLGVDIVIRIAVLFRR